MMMAATRRSNRARKASPKSKKRSRKTHHDHYNDSEQQQQQQQYRGQEYNLSEEPDTRIHDGGKSRLSSAPSGMSSSRHGDVGDSGIDSGNGHVEPDSLKDRLAHSASNHVSTRQTVQEDRYHSPSSSPKRQARASEASVTSSDSSPLRETSSEVNASVATLQDHHSQETRSKHKKRKSSKGEEPPQKASPVRERPAALLNHADLSGADEASAIETQSRTDHPVAARSSQNSETSSVSSNYAEQTLRSKKEGRVVNEAKSDVKEKGARVLEEESSEQSEQDTTDTAEDRKSLDAMSVTSERRKKRRKLQARLEQARHSLASPHIDAAVEACKSSAGTLPGPQEISLLQEFRRVFQQELIRLRLELDTFRHFCSKQMETEAEDVFCRHREKKAQEGTGREKTDREKNDCCTQTKGAEGQASEVSKKKTGEELEDMEEQLTLRQNDLQDYEKEILEVETMLNQRQAICERRQSALLALDEELQCLREDIFSKKENLKTDSDTNVERARKNWDLVRRHLTDKQAMLEAAVQRYKTQIASSNAALAAKDTLIAHLQKQLKEWQVTVKAKERKVSQLESKLVLATEEMHVLNAMKDSGPVPPEADPLSHSQTRRASLRPGSSLLQRQRSSEASDRSGTGRGSLRSSSTSDPHQDGGTTLERNSSSRAVSAPASEGRKSSTAQAPNSVLARGKSSNNLSRSQSVRDRRMQQRRTSIAVTAGGGGSGGGGGGGSGGGGGEGGDAPNSAACTIL